MPVELELNSLNAAAAKAATDSDFPGAVAFLRQVLGQQTATLGPDHPDLATTLNNLALMLEKVGDTPEAGRCYRRAYAIAAAALGPDDPAVQVSHANLEAFYRAHGSDGDVVAATMLGGLHDFPSAAEETRILSPATPLPPQAVAPPPQRNPPPPPARPVPQTASAPLTPPQSEALNGSLWRLPLATVVAVAVALAVAALWLAGPSVPGERPAATTVADAPSVGAPPVAAPPVKTEPAVSAAASTPAPKAASSAETAAVPAAGGAAGGPPPAVSPPPARPATPTSARVIDARLCGALSRGGAWRCAPISNPRAGGAVYYYTRVASARDAVIRHRWTRDGRVVRVVDLRIRANPADGYRTFSRQTGGALAPGAWQVALLDSSGTVLEQQSFVVQ